jgi:hypothetical protein
MADADVAVACLIDPSYTHRAQHGSSQISTMVKTVAQVFRRKWKQLKPTLSKTIKGGKLRQPEEGVDTRWLFTSKQANWLFQCPGFIEHAALALKQVAAPDSTADLAKKEGWTIQQMLNPVAQAAAAVVSDLSAPFAQATKWTQRHGSMRAHETLCYLVRLVQKLEDALRVVGVAWARVDDGVQLQATKLVEAWQKDTAAQTIFESYQADAADVGADADDETAGAGEVDDAAGESKRAAKEPTWFDKARPAFEDEGRPLHFTDVGTLLPLLSRFATEASKGPLTLAIGLELTRQFVSASKEKLVKKVEGWFSPDLLLAAIADAEHGQRVAELLVQVGRDAAFTAAARHLNTTSASLKLSIDTNAHYKGPLTAFTADASWGLLEQLAAADSQDALWRDDALLPLLRAWKHWFAAMPVANAHLESVIKLVKQLTGQ